MMGDSTEKNKRDTGIDAVKAFLVILVVMGHCIVYGSEETANKMIEYENFFFYRAIYSFHMPLFIIISGYFTYYSLNKYRNSSIIIVKRLRKLIYPLLILAFFSELSHIKELNWKITVIESVMDFTSRFISHLWFGWAIFFFTIIVWFANRFLASRLRVLFYFIIFVATFELKMYPNIPAYQTEFPMFLFGYFIAYKGIAKKKWFIAAINPTFSLTVIYIMIFALLVYFYPRNMLVENMSLFSKQNAQLYLMKLVYRWFVWIINSFIIYSIVVKCYKKVEGNIRLRKQVFFLSENSYWIYLIHSYFNLHILSYIVIKYNIHMNWLLICLEAIFITFLSLGLAMIINKILSLNKREENA